MELSAVICPVHCGDKHMWLLDTQSVADIMAD